MHVIDLKVEREEALYDSFDPNGVKLSEDVKSYLLSRVQERNIGQEVELRIHCEEPVREERLRTSLKNWTTEELDEAGREAHRNLMQQVILFVVGVLFLAASIALEQAVGIVWHTVLSTIGAFSMWEAASIWIIRNPKLRVRRRMIRTLCENTKLTIVNESQEEES